MAGLLLTGGPDISASFHRELTGDTALIQDPEPERDAWEFLAALDPAAVERRRVRQERSDAWGFTQSDSPVDISSLVRGAV